jgi:hypothetical protein
MTHSVTGGNHSPTRPGSPASAQASPGATATSMPTSKPFATPHLRLPGLMESDAILGERRPP